MKTEYTTRHVEGAYTHEYEYLESFDIKVLVSNGTCNWGKNPNWVEVTIYVNDSVALKEWKDVLNSGAVIQGSPVGGDMTLMTHTYGRPPVPQVYGNGYAYPRVRWMASVKNVPAGTYLI